jgi:apolipoprotein N-acyltransferase
MGHGGQNQRPLSCGLQDPNVVVGPMICFESTYSWFARRQTAMGATLLSVVTDDTWFGQTAAAKQHLAMSAVRAAETHRSLVRSAATGISAIFDSRGRLISSLPLFRQGIIVADVPIETEVTPYVRFGDLFIVACAAVWLSAAAWSLLRQAGALSK